MRDTLRLYQQKISMMNTSLRRYMRPVTLKKLLAISLALVALFSSLVSHSQTEGTGKTSSSSLESEYQKELDRWMLQAYEGDRDAQFKVGVLFTNDQFKSADMGQSAYWYKQAARQGHALAQYNLGHQYLTGTGVKRNEREAMKWWLKAAEQDHPLAQFNIGRAYYLGIGLEEDHDQSRLWFRRAAKNNEPKSIDILQQLGWSEAGDSQVLAKKEEFDEPVASIASTTPASVTEASTDSSQTPQSKPIEETIESTPVEATPIEATPVADSATSQQVADKEEADKEEAKKATDPIAVYTNPAKRSVLITILTIRDQLNVVNTTPEWTEVTNDSGFPVWVHQDYIVVADDIGTIQGSSVNARSVPLITSGTIVGQLNDTETLAVLDKKNSWYRVMSPSRFKAWVKTDEFNRKPTPRSENSATQNNIAKTNPVNSEINNAVNAAQNAQADTVVSSGTNNSDDNDWLFSQAADSYTLQLASFDEAAKIAEFRSRKKFQNNPNLRSFTSYSRDITWTYFLYGAFDSSEAAKKARTEINQKLAWVRSFGKLQQNRCVAWKKQIPAPRELNKYCS